jgi:uncharacterized membrane protein YdbT with pleckstrin-like domain
MSYMRTQLKKDERVLIIIRQHWMVLLVPFLLWTVSAILLIWLMSTTGFLIALAASLYPLYEYLSWKSNLWAVTNLRVVDESGFLGRYSKESPLDKINNVEYDQNFWGRLLGFGSVDIQTAAELGETTYEIIHHPKQLKDTITLAQEEYKRSQLTKQASALAAAITASTPLQTSPQLIADELQKLFDLHQQGALTEEEYLAQKKKLL